MDKDNIPRDEYRYGFNDKDVSIMKTDKGISEAIVRQISRLKNEPKWMEEKRVEAFHIFQGLSLPKFGPDLSFIDLQTYTGFTGR